MWHLYSFSRTRVELNLSEREIPSVLVREQIGSNFIQYALVSKNVSAFDSFIVYCGIVKLILMSWEPLCEPRFVLCFSVLRVTSGPRVKLVGRKNALNPPVVYSTDRSKAVVPVLVLLFVPLWFILRGDLFYVLPCVILFLCFQSF